MSLLSANIWLIAGGQVIEEQMCDVSRIQGARCSSFQGETLTNALFCVKINLPTNMQAVLFQVIFQMKSFLLLQKCSVIV